MTSPQDKFNRTFQEFAADLIRVNPEDADLRMYHMGIQGLLMASPSTLHSGFYQHVAVPFGERILVRDESFFLENDYSETDVTDVDLINKVKTMYASMSASDKDAVCKYMRLLVLLARKIYE